MTLLYLKMHLWFQSKGALRLATICRRHRRFRPEDAEDGCSQEETTVIWLTVLSKVRHLASAIALSLDLFFRAGCGLPTERHPVAAF
jgi:hypothetical protein